MADDFVSKFGFDVVGAEDLKNKLNRALKEYNLLVEDINKVNAQFNKQGKANQVVIQGITEDQKRFNVALTANGGVWKKIDTEVRKTTKSLTSYEQRLKSIVDSERKALVGRKVKSIDVAKDEAGKDLRNAARFNEIVDFERRALAQRLAYEARYQRGVTTVINAIRNHEVAAMRLRTRVQATYMRDRLRMLDQIRTAERRHAAQTAAQQARNNKISADILAQIRQSERLAAHKRRLAAEADNLRNKYADLGRTGKRAGEEVLLSWRSVQRLFVVQLFHQAISRFRLEMEEALRTTVDYSKRVAEIQTISQSAAESTEQWNVQLRSISEEFGVELIEVTSAAYEALSNQIIETTSDLGFIRDAQELARVTNSDLATSVDALSSVINSFGYNISETEKLSAILFRTVDLGKTTLNELSQNLGRVNSLSKILGVSFEEQQAALSTLTIQGLKDHTAKTLLINIYQKMIRPTEHMSEIFKEWGVSSGEAAISTYGLGNVLAALIRRAEQSGDFAEELGEQFQELRATTGAASLNLETFAAHLQQHLNAGAEYTRAFEIANNSMGASVDKQMARLKNQFISWGTSVVSTFVSVAQSFGGLDKVVRSAANVVGTLTLTWGIYKGVAIATSLTQSIMNGRFTTTNFLLLLMQRRITAVTAAYGILRASLGGIVAIGVTALSALIVHQLQWKDRVNRSVESVRESFKKLSEETIQQVIARVQKWGDSFGDQTKSITKRLGELNLYFTRSVSQLSVDMDKLNKSFTSTTQSLFKNQLSVLKSGLSDITREIRERESELQELRQGLEQSVKQQTDLALEFKVDAADTPIDKIGVLNDAAGELLARLRDPNLPDSERNKLRNEIVAILQDSRSIAQQQGFDTSVIEEQILGIINEQNAAYREQIALKQELQEAAKREKAEQQQRLNFVKNNLDRITTLDKDTTIQDFDKIAAELRNAARVANLNLQEQLQLDQLIVTHRKSFEQNDLRVTLEKELSKQNALANQLQAQFDKGKKVLSESAVELANTLGGAVETAITELDRLNSVNEARSSDLFGSLKRRTEAQELRREINELTHAYNALLESQKRGDERSVTHLQELTRKRTLELRNRFINLFGNQILERDAKGQPTKSVEISFSDIIKQLNLFGQKRAVFQTHAKDVHELEAVLNQLGEKLKSLDGIKVETDFNWQAGTQQNRAGMLELLDSVDLLIRKYQQLQQMEQRGVLPTGNPVQGNYRGGYFAKGGRGSDTELAWLSRGEYVWDRRTTRQHHSMLKGMHDESKYINRGGSSNQVYNFGGITVNNNHGSATMAASDIVREIRRAMRTGKLSVS